MIKEKVTLKKLAAMLNLDVSSVSLALRDSAKISAQTKQRVCELAEQYNYFPNIAARQLRSSVPKLIGLVLPAAMNSLTVPVAGKTIQFLAEQCALKDIIFQILSVAYLNEKNMFNLLPEALFIWGDVPRNFIEARPLRQRQVIVLDPNHISYEKFTGRFVGIDDFSGGKAVAKHFLERKVSRLLLIQARSDHLGHNRRLAGVLHGWLKYRPASSVSKCALSELSEADLTQLIRQGNSAIFCSNDWGALQVWHRLRQLGVRIPEDVRLAGFDGEEAALLLGITTVVFDWQTLAKEALRMMFQLIMPSGKAKSPPLSVAVPVILQEGKTT